MRPKIIDKTMTAFNARIFLDAELPMYISMADKDLTALSSPQLSSEGGHQNGVNHQEKKLDDYWAANAVVEAVHAAAHRITKCNNERDIFIKYYFDKWRDIEIARYYNVSTATITRRKTDALVDFAIRLNHQKNNSKHNCDWLDSLVEYQS